MLVVLGQITTYHELQNTTVKYILCAYCSFIPELHSSNKVLRQHHFDIDQMTLIKWNKLFSNIFDLMKSIAVPSVSVFCILNTV